MSIGTLSLPDVKCKVEDAQEYAHTAKVRPFNAGAKSSNRPRTTDIAMFRSIVIAAATAIALSDSSPNIKIIDKV